MITVTSLTDLVGRTPMLEMTNFNAIHNPDARVLAKLEYFNPAGSIKDRIALAMIRDAEERGTLLPGGTLIEPTSGNTGIGLAFVAASRGYRLILTMPETMSVERRRILQALGAELVLTPGSDGMKGAIARAGELKSEIDGSIILGQFDNPANPEIHYRTTGPEIWEQASGRVDILVAGVGTGGTITGAGRFLKEMNPEVQIVAVQPLDSPVLTGGKPGPHKIQGIGAGFVPVNFDPAVVDEIFDISTDEAFSAARELARTEGLLAGISSGAALYAASRLASRPENAGKSVVVVLPDTGERYLSTQLFDIAE